jgi:hypothetical protein
MSKTENCFSWISYFFFSFLLPYLSLYGDANIYDKVTDDTSSGGVEGIIIDSYTNIPISHANVYIMHGNMIVASAVTDEKGYYHISGLAPRLHIIKVKAPSYQQNAKLLVPIAGKTTLFNFALDLPSVKMMGQIIHFFTGQSIANATIEILKDNLLIDSIHSNEEGIYVLDLAPNKYEVRVSMADFKSVNQQVEIVPYAIATINFALEPFGTLSGQVVHFFTDQPIEGASVGIWQDGTLLHAISTDANGNFNLKGYGYYQCIIHAPGFYPLEQEAQIHSFQAIELKFKLTCFEPSPPPYFHGKVTKKVINHHIIDYIHQFTWKVSHDPTVVSYRIYCEGKCLATVSANEIPSIEIHGRGRKPKFYQLRAVNAFGQESMPLTIQLPHKK